MKNKVRYILLTLFMLVVSMAFVSAACTDADVSDGSDYMQINSSAYSTIPITGDEIWSAWEFFTPRLNFTATVTDTIIGKAANAASQLNWLTPLTPASVVVKNGSDTVSATNYTVELAAGYTNRWQINYTDAKYTSDSLTVTFTRTFIKNHDDIYLTPTDIKLGSTFADFITETSATAPAQNKLFKTNEASAGASINKTNWAVGWKLTHQKCATIVENDGIAALSSFAGWLPLIATVFAAGIILSLLYLLSHPEAASSINLMSIVQFGTIVIITTIVLGLGVVILSNMV